MSLLFSEFICLQCKTSSLVIHKDYKNEIHCTNCGTKYPLLEGKIPILISEPKKYLSRLFFQYSRHIRETEDTITRIQNKANSTLARKNKLLKITKALRKNVDYFKKINVLFEGLLRVGDIVQYQDDVFIQYLKDWTYLKRDWSNFENGENEIQLIQNNITSYLNKFNTDFQNCIFLGAGTGRLVLENSNAFKEVLAIDYSMTMVSMFYDLQEQDIEFYEILSKNIKKDEDVVKKYIASLTNAKTSFNLENINYFIGNALQIPLQTKSISVIFSIFFSDVVPIHLLIKEVERVLKEGGLFIHFGPLEYHFREIENMLTIEEIKNIFIMNNFDILEEGFVNTEHNKSDASLVFKTYENWSFVAKMGKSDRYNIKYETILKIRSNINYISHGTLTGEGYEQQTDLTFHFDESFENAELIFMILKELDGRRNLKQIFKTITEDFQIDENNITLVFTILEDLVKKNAILIVN